MHPSQHGVCLLGCAVQDRPNDGILVLAHTGHAERMVSHQDSQGGKECRTHPSNMYNTGQVATGVITVSLPDHAVPYRLCGTLFDTHRSEMHKLAKQPQEQKHATQTTSCTTDLALQILWQTLVHTRIPHAPFWQTAARTRASTPD